MANILPINKNAKSTFIVHRNDELARLARNSPSSTHFVFPYVEQWGTHHTKAMFLFYKDKSLRIIIHTANLISQDWG
jgi:tyrosyl-DNA phosphodiesterase 1